MAKFEMVVPNDVLKDLDYLTNNSEKIFGEMTKAGAEVVYQNVKSNVPSTFKNSKIMDCLTITKIYKTPTDDGINTKVAFYGYFENKNHKIVPAPLVCNVIEYGSTTVSKKPFMRRSFKKAQIEKAMLEAQKNLSKGLLKNE